jgi:hypothetical protein
MALVKAKVSSVVSKQLPEFVREDNAQFVAFLEAYYEFLEQQQNQTRNLESIRDIDDTLDSFIQYFRSELLSQIPTAILSDKRYLAKQINDVYRSKGSIKSYEFLFRILFNETPQLYFPKVDMLRVSDGKYDQRVILRCSETTGDSFNLIGQTISQGFNRAIVESVIKFQVGSDVISEITINENSIAGSFNTELPITGLDNITGTQITLDLLSILTDVQINNGGALYSVGSPVALLSGSGSDAQVEVTNIGYGSVDQIVIDSPGNGYTIGSELVFDNTDAGDVNDSLISARAIITDIDVDSILMEDGSYLQSETRNQFDLESATTGGIKAVQLLTGGFYYRKLPIVSASGGTGAKLIAIGSNIGRVIKVGITNPGVNYETPPIALFPVNIVVKDIVGSFSIGDDISVATQTFATEINVDNELLLESGDRIILESQQTPIGTVYSIDTDRNLITLFPSSDRIVIEKETDDGYLLSEEGLTFVNELSGQFETNQTIQNTTGASAKIISGTGNHAEAVGVTGALGRTLGKFVNADGKVSESSKKIQDSLFYQEYSYVIKVGQSIDKYRDAVKKLLHPIGLALFGEVTIQSTVSALTTPVLEFAELLRIIRSFLDLKIKAVGNYRTEFEDDSTRSKEQITLFYGGIISNILDVRTLPSEFLPVLFLPNLTPEEVYLLDLRVENPESLKTLLLKFNIVASPTFTQAVNSLFIKSSPSSESAQFGPTLAWLERWKFTFAPYAAGSKNSIGVYRGEWDQDYPAPNVGYWDSFANTQIKDFSEIIIGDVINNPNRRTNYAKESHIDIIKIDADPTLDSARVTMDSTGVTMDDFDEITLLFDSTATTRLDSTSVTMDTM